MLYFNAIDDIGSSLTTSDGIWGTILKALRSMFFAVNELIYKFIAILYDMFQALCNARLLSSTEFGMLAEKVGVLLGVIMLFKVMVEFIQLLVEPDKITDNQKGATAIIKRVIIVIVMLGVSGFVFDALYYVQNYVLTQNVLYGFLLPSSDTTFHSESFGNVLSARVFGSFYTVNEQILSVEEAEAITCVDYRNLLLNNIAENRDYSTGTFCLNAFSSITVKNANGTSEGYTRSYFVMDYNFLLQTLAGVALIYLLVSYVIQVGVRVVQLTFLQIISPAAIVGYLSPKQDNMFSKWSKLYFATYIDAFIRMAIIYFAAFMCSVLLDKIDSGTSEFWASIGDPSDLFTRSMFVIAMILALLTFAKKAPDLIKELIPNASGRYNPSWKNIVGLGAAVGGIAGAGTGAAVGLVAAGGNPIGLLTGAFRGGATGIKSKNIGSAITGAGSKQWKAQISANKKMADIRANGGSWFGSHIASAQAAFGRRNAYEKLEDEYQEAEAYKSAFSAAKSKADSEVNKFEDNYKVKIGGRTWTLAELNKARTSDAYDETMQAKLERVYNKVHGYARDQAMNNNGALKSGSMTWEVARDATGALTWDVSDSSRSDSFTASDISTNTEIAANMTRILGSSQAGHTGNRFADAKTANDFYETKVDNKINDTKYKRAKANAGK